MTTAVGMMPEKHFGVVVLSNMQSAQLPELLRQYIFDRALGAPMRDLSGESYARYVVQRKRADSVEKAQAVEHPANAMPPLPLTAYAGTYADSLYGEATVSVKDGHLELVRGEWHAPLEYWNATNFRWSASSVTGPMFIKFEVGAGQQRHRAVFRSCRRPIAAEQERWRPRWSRRTRRITVKTLNTRTFVSLAASVVIAAPVAAQSKPTYEQFIAPAYPSELVSAKKADRIAWLAYDRGLRNVYTAAAPDFKATRLTKFLDDDGVILSELEISDDGSVVTFVRGSEPNRQGWLANPSSYPNGPERAIWAAKTDGSGAWKLGDGAGQSLSPDGKSVVFVKDGQIFRLATATRASASEKNEQPFIKEWGRQAPAPLVARRIEARVRERARQSRARSPSTT